MVKSSKEKYSKTCSLSTSDHSIKSREKEYNFMEWLFLFKKAKNE